MMFARNRVYVQFRNHRSATLATDEAFQRRGKHMVDDDSDFMRQWRRSILLIDMMLAAAIVMVTAILLRELG
jgi:hypothetical protein